MNLSKSLLLASMSLFLITSCSKDEDQLKAPQSENIPELGDVKSDVTYGPIIQSIHNVEESETLSERNSTFYSPWAKITTNDLRELSKGNIKYTDLDFLQNQFTAVIKQGSRRPQSISINDYRNGKGTNPTGKYNWYAYMRTVGKKTKTTNSKPTKWQTGSPIISYRNNTRTNRWMSYKGEIRITDTKTT